MYQNRNHDLRGDTSLAPVAPLLFIIIVVMLTSILLFLWGLRVNAAFNANALLPDVEVFEGLQRDERWEVRSQRAALCDAYFRSAIRISDLTGKSPDAWVPAVGYSAVRPLALMGSESRAQQEVLTQLLDDRRWLLPDQRGPLCHALYHSQGAPALDDVG